MAQSNSLTQLSGTNRETIQQNPNPFGSATRITQVQTDASEAIIPVISQSGASDAESQDSKKKKKKESKSKTPTKENPNTDDKKDGKGRGRGRGRGG